MLESSHTSVLWDKLGGLSSLIPLQDIFPASRRLDAIPSRPFSISSFNFWCEPLGKPALCWGWRSACCGGTYALPSSPQALLRTHQPCLSGPPKYLLSPRKSPNPPLSRNGLFSSKMETNPKLWFAPFSQCLRWKGDQESASVEFGFPL